MAIIYTYPSATPTLKDTVIGSQIDPITEENRTVQFGVGQLATLSTQNYYETTVTVTNPQLTALETTDVELIAAPGANKCIRVLFVSAFLDYTAPAFTFASTLNGQINGNTQFIITSSFGQSAADAVAGANISSNVDIPLNSALVLGTTGAVGGGGGSSMQIKIRYQILDINNF